MVWISLGEGVAIGAVMSGGDVLFPTPDLVLKPGFRVVLLAEKGALDDIVTMFRVSSDYY